MSSPDGVAGRPDRLEELAPWLFSRTTGGVRWGLERTRELLAGVGDPHRLFRCVHVAGTNGKGSVAAMTAAALREAAGRGGGGAVGLYSSPHLVSFAERIRIDGMPAPDALVLGAAARLRPDIERTGATFFEATTALAFLCFAEAGVRTAVVEVGLGGRLDATNVIRPMACAITNVSLDHTEYLGPTLGAIAREKAGILKPGVPAVTGITPEDGPEMPGEALAAVREAAAAVGAPLFELDDLAAVEVGAADEAGAALRVRSVAWGERALRIPLVGEHQARNAALAIELLALLPEEARPEWAEIERGLAAVRWPGRAQVERIRGTRWLLDVAHNPAGAASLATTLDALDLPRPRVLVFGVLADKDWREMLPPLLARTDAVLLTIPASSPPGRSWDPAPAAAWIAARGHPPPRVVPHLPDALRRAETLAPHGTIVVTGSFHTVGDSMAELGLPG